MERWLLTYADMITLLAAFFLMLYSMSVVSKGKFTQMANSMRSSFGGTVESGSAVLNGEGARSTYIGTLSAEEYRQYIEAMRNLRGIMEQPEMRGKMSMRSDERGIVISLLSDNMLFERGQAQLKVESFAALQRVLQVIQPIPNKIQIEGHTCNIPIHTALFPSNWELSSGRAGAVLRYFTEQQRLNPQRFLAAGYADTSPLAANVSEENRARNRRVDIVILKSEEQQEADFARKSEIRRITTDSNATMSEPRAPDIHSNREP
jgi:chemotaxis protein MotB